MTSVRLPPVGFWSYARQDDQLSFGRLSELRSLLIHELQQLYGRDPVKLFQDKKTIPHGSSWEKEIRKAIRQSVFFVPIITPNFVQSDWCCREVELFLEREAEIRAAYDEGDETSRIFPIMFIDIQDTEPDHPEVLAQLLERQWFDFSGFRHKSYDEPAVREALSELATSMRRLLRRKLEPQSEEAKAEASADSTRQHATIALAGAEVLASEVEAPPEVDEAAERASPNDVGEGGATEPPVTTRTEAEPEPPLPPKAQPRAPRPEPEVAADAPQPIKVGDVLNHIFEVTRFIKSGGMGQVFEGRNVNTGERVAIKALLPSLAADQRVVSLFYRESLTLTRLHHEALVQYRVLAQEPRLKALYIVTEFIDGVELGDRLGSLDRSEETLRGLLVRLASGLAVAHRFGAVHRDMSVDNVMLPEGDMARAKIIDFGIAKDIGGDLPTLIGSGFAGKLGFAAPEQLGEQGGEIGPWTDVYSLGLVILAAARGTKVPMGTTFADALTRRHEPIDVSALPPRLRPVVAAMLEPDLTRRLRSMDELLARLAEGPGDEPVEAAEAPEEEELAPAQLAEEESAPAPDETATSMAAAVPGSESETVFEPEFGVGLGSDPGADEAEALPLPTEESGASRLTASPKKWLLLILPVAIILGLWSFGPRLFGPPAPPADAAAGPLVTLVAGEDAWLRIEDGAGGRILFEGILTPGQRFTVPQTAQRPMIRTARPQALRVLVDGRDLGPLALSEQTISNVSLRAEDVTARLQSVAAPPPVPDRTWLHGRWCIIGSGDIVWTISEDSGQLVRTLSTPAADGASSSQLRQEEEIEQTLEGRVRTEFATYRRDSGGRSVTVNDGGVVHRLERCS